MYQQYKLECEQNNKLSASDRVYRNIFNLDFNLTFKPTQKDTCKRCDVYKIKIDLTHDVAIIAQLEAEQVTSQYDIRKPKESTKKL